MTSVFAIRVLETFPDEKMWTKGDYVYFGPDFITSNISPAFSTYFTDHTAAMTARRTKLAKFEHTVFEIVEFKECKR